MNIFYLSVIILLIIVNIDAFMTRLHGGNRFSITSYYVNYHPSRSICETGNRGATYFATTDLANDLISSKYTTLLSGFVNDYGDLPQLTFSEKQLLASGERIQKQARSGRSGFGLVVVDVKASADTVFETLTRFGSYEAMIPTVKSAKIYSSNDRATVAEFRLSKFGLRVNVVHTVIPEEKSIKFSLDENQPNLVLRRADGFWHVQSLPERPGFSRVWLSASVVASRFVPTMIVDYAASRALPRATTWLQPYFEQNVSEHSKLLNDDSC